MGRRTLTRVYEEQEYDTRNDNGVLCLVDEDGRFREFDVVRPTGDADSENLLVEFECGLLVILYLISMYKVRIVKLVRA